MFCAHAKRRGVRLGRVLSGTGGNAGRAVTDPAVRRDVAELRPEPASGPTFAVSLGLAGVYRGLRGGFRLGDGP